jgi:hypothetical protein
MFHCSIKASACAIALKLQLETQLSNRSFRKNIANMCGGADWVKVAQDRVQWRAFLSTVMNLRTTSSFSRRAVLRGN